MIEAKQNHAMLPIQLRLIVFVIQFFDRNKIISLYLYFRIFRVILSDRTRNTEQFIFLVIKSDQLLNKSR